MKKYIYSIRALKIIAVEIERIENTKDQSKFVEIFKSTRDYSESNIIVINNVRSRLLSSDDILPEKSTSDFLKRASRRS